MVDDAQAGKGADRKRRREPEPREPREVPPLAAPRSGGGDGGADDADGAAPQSLEAATAGPALSKGALKRLRRQQRAQSQAVQARAEPAAFVVAASPEAEADAGAEADSATESAAVLGAVLRAQAPGRYFASSRALGNFACYNCRERGHFAMSCPRAAKRGACYVCADPAHEAANCPLDTCFVCDEPGHIWFHCPNAAAIDEAIAQRGRPRGYGRAFVMMLGPREATSRLMPPAWHQPRHSHGLAFAERRDALPATDVFAERCCGLCGSEEHATLHCSAGGGNGAIAAADLRRVQCCTCGARGHAFCDSRGASAEQRNAAARRAARRDEAEAAFASAAPCDEDDAFAMDGNAARLPPLRHAMNGGVIEDADVLAEVAAVIAAECASESRGRCFNCGGTAHSGAVCPHQRSTGFNDGIGPGANRRGRPEYDDIRRGNGCEPDRGLEFESRLRRGGGGGGRRVLDVSAKDEWVNFGNGGGDERRVVRIVVAQPQPQPQPWTQAQQPQQRWQPPPMPEQQSQAPPPQHRQARPSQQLQVPPSQPWWQGSAELARDRQRLLDDKSLSSEARKSQLQKLKKRARRSAAAQPSPQPAQQPVQQPVQPSATRLPQAQGRTKKRLRE